MEDKEAIGILTKFLEKYPLSDEEKGAVRHAIGVLGWTKLVEGWSALRQLTEVESSANVLGTGR